MSDWISVNRLPDEEQDVIVWTSLGKMRLGYWMEYGHDGIEWFDSDGDLIANVTHWMLPTPPERKP